MIVREDLLKRLRSAFNLNIYEVKIWTALLSKGAATAGELSDMSNVPRSRSYDVLESLEKKGFIIMKLGRPIKYLAVSPHDILKRVKKEIEEKAKREIKMVEEIQGTDVYSELNGMFKNGIENVDPASIAGSFKGRASTYEHMLNLLSEAKNEVIIVTTAEGLARKVEHMKTTLRKLKQQKVNIRIAAPLKTQNAKDAALELKDIANVYDKDLNARFVLVDGKELVFMIKDEKNLHESTDIGIWVSTPFFAQALKDMFEATLEKK